MKKLLADFLKIKESDIEKYTITTSHDLSKRWESDSVIEGLINQPEWEVVTFLPERYHWIQLEDLLVFIYDKNLII